MKSDYDAHVALYTDNEALVYFTIRKNWGWLITDEDILQIGRLGLWRACCSYDSSRTRFSTYAVRCIYNAITFELQKRQRYQVSSLDSAAHTNSKDGSVTSIMETLTLPEESMDDCGVFARDFFDSRDTREKAIMCLTAIGYTRTEVAQRLNVSQSTVVRVLKYLKKDYLGGNYENRKDM